MGAPDLARRLIEAFEIDECVTAAIDDELEEQVATVYQFIPAAAYLDDGDANE